MALQSEVDICNLALTGWLGAQPITSQDFANPGDKVSALCKLNYPECRDAVLEDGDWQFARRIYALPEAASVPPIDDPRPPYVGRLFHKPSEVLRVIRIDEGTDDWRAGWDLVGELLVTDAGSDGDPIYADAVWRLEDTTRYSQGFVSALVVRLAAAMAIGITESLERRSTLMGIYEQNLLPKALKNEGRQGTSQRVRSDRLRRSRR